MSRTMDTPESKFATDLKAATHVSPAITSFVETLTDPALSQMDRLNQVAIIAFRFGGMNDARSAELMRVWMIHDPVACHRFFVGEDRLRVDKRVRDLQAQNARFVQTVTKLNATVVELKHKLGLVEETQSGASQTESCDGRNTRSKIGDFASHGSSQPEKVDSCADRSLSNV